MRTEVIAMEELAQLLAVQLQHGSAPLRVTGVSMHPILRNRKDTVMLRPFTGQLKRGDVVLFQRQDGSYILHRAISKPRQQQFLCSGDNQYVAEQVNFSQVLAVVESFTRGKKHVSVNDPVYRFVSWFWVAIFPLRKPILKLRRRLGRLRYKK